MYESAELLSVLPAWVPWVAPLRSILGGLFMGWLASTGTWLILRPRKLEGLHWSEVARRRWTLRMGFGFALYVALVIGLASLVLHRGPLAPWVGWPLGVLTMVAVLLGARLGSLPFRRGETSRGDLRGTLAWIWVSRGHLLVLVALGFLAPADPGLGLVLCLGLAVAICLMWSRGAGMRTGRLMGLVGPPPERILAIVQRAADSLGVKVERVGLIRWKKANAFAFPSSGDLGYTEGILEALDDEGLEAVTAHELGHLAESPAVRRLRSVLVLTLVPFVATRAILTWAHWGVLVVMLLLLILSNRRTMTWIRAREHDADAVGHGHMGHSEAYGKALASIYEFNEVPAVLGRQRTHPELYDRLLECGVEPDFPRPEPPSGRGSRVWGLVLLVFLTTFVVVEHVVTVMVADQAYPGTTVDLFAEAMTGGSAWTLKELAWTAEDEDRWEDAGVFWLAVYDEAPWDQDAVLAVSMVYARRGHCEEARDWLDSAVPEHASEGAHMAAERSLALCLSYGATVPPGSQP